MSGFTGPVAGGNPGGNAGGDLGGTYPNPDVETVDGETAATIKNGAALGATAAQKASNGSDFASAATVRANIAAKANYATGGDQALTPADIAAATTAQGALADTALQVGDTLRLRATASKTNDTSYTLATYTEITELDTTFTAVAGDHIITATIIYVQTVALGVQRFAYRIDGGAWVQFGIETSPSGYGKMVNCRAVVTLSAGSRQIEVAIKTTGGSTDVRGSSEAPSTLTIEGP